LSWRATSLGPQGKKAACLVQNQPMLGPAHHSFWLKTRRWTLALLAAWLLVNLCVPWFARDLDRFSFLGFPLGYWLAAEGALLVYALLIAIYVVVMDRLEAALLAETAADEPSTGEPPTQG
jgi:putative solute:sodium symporter small subunit